MKNIYTLIFAKNNTNEDENYILDFSSETKEEEIVRKALNELVFSPRQEIIDNILKFAREGEM